MKKYLFFLSISILCIKLIYAQQTQEQIQKPQVIKDKITGISWIKIKGGRFMMGSQFENDEKPIHERFVNDFYISQSEITVAQYISCLKAEACEYNRDRSAIDPEGEWSVNRKCNFNWGDFYWFVENKDDHPMNCITWNEARDYAIWAGGDLPSEVQWEYAAKSEGKNISYPWGNEIANCDYSIIYGDKNKGCNLNKTWEVCSKSKGNTIQGLCDMSGNVWEWVLDEFHDYNKQKRNDDMPFCHYEDCDEETLSERICRGGSWKDPPTFSRTTNRNSLPSNKISSKVGFRVVKKI